MSQRNLSRSWLRSFLKLGQDAEVEQIPNHEIKRQEDTVLRALEILDHRPGVMLADEVGMGKTFEAIGIIASFRQQNRRSRILVITPGPDLNRQWLTVMARFRERGFYHFKRDEYVGVDRLQELPEKSRKYPITFAPINIFHDVRRDEEKQFIMNAFFRWRGLHRNTRRDICKAFFGTVRKVSDVTKLKPYMGEWSYKDLQNLLGDAFSQSVREREFAPDDVIKGLNDIYNEEGIKGFKNRERVRRAISRARFKFLNGILPNFSLLVVDEAHKLKNPHTIRVQAFSNILYNKYQNVAFLTATPFQLGVHELDQVFKIFSYARINTDEKRRVLVAAKDLFSKIREYQQAYAELEVSWRYLDVEKVQQFRSWYEPNLCLTGSLPSRELRSLVGVIDRLVRLKRDEIEPRFRQWMIRSLKGDKHDYRDHDLAKFPPNKRTALPFLLYERMIFELYRKSHRTYKAAVEINMTSSFEAASRGALLDQTYSDEDIEAYRKLICKLIRSKRSRGTHPKVHNVAKEACGAMLRNEKTLIFCERIHTVQSIKSQCDKFWYRHILSLWRKVFPNSNDQDLWKQQRNFQKYFTTSTSPYYLTLRENYAQAFIGDLDVSNKEQGAILQLANELLHSMRVTGVSIDRVNYRIAKRCLEKAVISRFFDRLPRVFDRLPKYAKQAVQNISDEQFLTAGLDLVVDEEEGDTEVSEIGVTPQWQISRSLAELILTPYRKGLWYYMKDDLAKLPPNDRVRFVEAVRAFLTKKEVEFLPALLNRTKPAKGRYTAEAVSNALEEWWSEPNCPWRIRLEALAKYLVERTETQRGRILEVGLRGGVPVRHTLDTEYREGLIEGFNTPFYPMILICNRPMQEGLDLHRECRRLVHHDLCWNPAQLEQRVGRLDRVGSKLQKDREFNPEALLWIHYPLIDRTIDVHQYQIVKEREKWLDFLLGRPPEFSTYHLDGEKIHPLPAGLVRALTINLEPKPFD